MPSAADHWGCLGDDRLAERLVVRGITLALAATNITSANRWRRHFQRHVNRMNSRRQLCFIRSQLVRGHKSKIVITALELDISVLALRHCGAGIETRLPEDDLCNTSTTTAARRHSTTEYSLRARSAATCAGDGDVSDHDRCRTTTILKSSRHQNASD